ncbi:acyltransferase family protein [Luteolibacter pohnpeiensis]|uniref:Acyltransferase family protein n=1 Tax=Luteolibacter pohnpeiensis TaxID=454153 RepID=A0A934S503_9BACT|nr:acyltransferase family protein [Luteolibacter pohnpeiensis]MBK1882377.1 acyltransferase family protein [Luteolibacter pohnpeiensis]
MSEATSRNSWIDSLKGVLIFLVVYGHAIQFTGYDWATDWTNSEFWKDPFFKTVYMFHMPLFMAISGYLSIGSIRRLTFKNVTCRRFKQLMLPLIGWSVLYQVSLTALKGDWSAFPEHLLHELGFGLWFLWAAFLSMVITAALKWGKFDHVFGCIVAILVVLAVPDYEVLANFKYTFPFFVIGYQCAKLGVFSKVKLGLPGWIAIGAASVGCWYLWTERTYIYVSGMALDAGNLTHVLVRYASGLFLGLSFLGVWSVIHRRCLGSMFNSLGRRSLDIYIVQNYAFVALIHFNFPMKNSPWFALTMAPWIALLVCIIAVFAGWVMERIPIFSSLLLGRKGGMQSSNPSGPIAFFAHERGDARVKKRIAALRDRGWQVTGYTFHRVRDKVEAEPDWNNVHLGTTYNRRYIHRLWTLANSILILWRNREQYANSSVLYVVNTDNAVLALVARWLVGVRIPLVLELADIQPVMYSAGWPGKIMRRVEREVLNRSALLVTTSPGFIQHYFLPTQKFAGEIFLLENKVYPSDRLEASHAIGKPISTGKPWVIGCFGAFRCRRSMQLMHALASRLGDRVLFRLRGYASGTITEDFPVLLGNLPNLRFEGPYDYPGDLSEMYGAIDLNWSFDETDPGGNSAWLLPNRIYEGGCFGVPVIAAKSTQTGDWVEERKCGWTFAESLEENLIAFFEQLQIDDWIAMKQHCLTIPRSKFAGETDYDILSAKLKDIAGIRP